MQIKKFILEELIKPIAPDNIPINEEKKPAHAQENSHDFSPLITENFIQLGADELAKAKEEAFNLGKQEGLAEAMLQRQAELDGHDLVGKIAQALLDLKDSRNIWQQNMAQSSAKLAYSIAQKLTYNLLAANSEEKIANFIKDILPIIIDEPQIVIKASANMDEIQKSLDDKLRSMNLIEKIEFRADESITPHDCTVMLAGGELKLSSDELAAKVEEVFRNYFS